MDATLQDPLVGRLLDGRYLVESRIARGGMATVYLAVDRRLDREIALKVMHPHLADDDDFVARFVREARSAARLSHPNVVQVFDQGADGDILYLAMEHLPGRTLRDVLNDRAVLTPREALTVLEPVLDALSAAHRAGIVHRDIKPENVILTDEGRVKVADFGLARAVTGGPTQTGALIGTVAYLSPELVSRGIADARSDVYAAGIMAFEMLTGRQPFVGDVPMQIAYRHVHEDVPAPSTIAPGLPTELDHLVLVATARDADERPVDAADWLRGVRAVRAELSDEVLDARPAVAPRADGGAGSARSSSGSSPAAPRGSAGAVDEGAGRTEIMTPPAQQNPTAALPGMGGLQRLRARALREAQEADGAARPIGRDRSAGAGGSAGPGRPGGPGGPGAAAGPGGPGAVRSAEDLALDELAQRRRRRGIIAAITVVVVAALLGFGAWWYAAGPGAFTTTPSLTNLTVAEASDLLIKQGLHGTAKDPEYSETVPKDQIVETDPQPGDRVRTGGTVTYRVSLGTAKRVVPALTGKSLDDATAALGALDLTVASTEQQYDPAIKKGQVIDSRPGQDAAVNAGGAIVLIVSKGPQPVQVPDLTHATIDEATGRLDQLGLKIDAVEQFSTDVDQGQVISQDPSSGTLLPGQTVHVIVSKGPELVQVPELVGQQARDASRQLRGLNLNVATNKVLGGYFGTVRGQDPPAGTMVAPGSTVTLTVV